METITISLNKYKDLLKHKLISLSSGDAIDVLRNLKSINDIKEELKTL